MTSPDAVPLGEYRGFSMTLSFYSFNRMYEITLHHTLSHTVALGTDTHGNITRLDNVLEGFENKMKACVEILDNVRSQLESAKVEVEKPFMHEDELKKKTARLDELNSLLNMDEKDNELLGEEPNEYAAEEPKKVVGLER